MIEDVIKTSRLVLRPFKASDVSLDYVEWLNDPEVNQYLESGGKIHSKETTIEWVNWTNNDSTRKLFGIFYQDKHIGNLTFYNIEKKHHCMRIGISIGKKLFWNQGFGVEALNSAVEFAFKTMGMHRIEAGVYEMNKNSQALFKKAGFYLESTMKDRVLFHNKYCDMLLFVKISN